MPTPPIVIRNHLHPATGPGPLLLLHGDSVTEPRPALLDLAGTFHDDRQGGLIAAARSGSGFGYIDGHGRWLVAPTLQETRDFSADGLSRFQSEGRWGYRDLRGEVIISARFDEAAPFSHGLAAVRQGTQWHYIDPTGTPAFPATFFHAGEFGKVGLALARATRFGKFGYIDRAGNWAVAPRFRRAAGFAGFPLAPATIDEERHGLIDASGQWIVPPTYAAIEAFQPEGYAWCRLPSSGRDLRAGYLDRDGREAMPFQEDVSDYLEAGLARVGSHRYAGVHGPFATSVPLAWGADFTSAGFTVARARVAANEAVGVDGPWGILAADGRFRHAPAGIVEPLTDADGDVPGPEPQTPLLPFLAHDGSVALLDRNGAVAYRLRHERDGTGESVVLCDAAGSVLWTSSALDAAARIAPFFEARPESLLEGLDDCADIVRLARSLLVQTEERLAALASGAPLPDAASAPTDAVARSDEDEEEDSLDADLAPGDGAAAGVSAWAGTSLRVWRAHADEHTWTRYEFLVDQRHAAMKQAHAEMAAALTAAFGPAQVHPGRADAQADDDILAWPVGAAPERLWLILHGRLRTGDGTFWCHIRLHCAPDEATLQRALARQASLAR